MRRQLPKLSKPLAVGGAVGLFAVAIAITYDALQPTATPVIPKPTPIIAQAPAAIQAPALDATSTTILELFNPSDQSLTQQLSETGLRQNIEQILTTSFVLTRCGHITEDDYRNSFLALIAYAQATKLSNDAASAEAVVRQIAESAGASYSLIYSRTKCDHPQLPGLAQQLLIWQKAYLPKQP